MKYKTVKNLFFTNQEILWTYIDRNELESLAKTFYKELQEKKIFTLQEITQEEFMKFIFEFINKTEKQITNLTDEINKFRNKITKLTDRHTQQKLIIDTLLKAEFKQNLIFKKKKWLEKETVYEYYNHKILYLKKKLSTVYHCLIPTLKNINEELSDFIITESFIDFILNKYHNENIPRIRIDILILLKTVLTEANKRIVNYIFKENHIDDLLTSYSESQSTTWSKCEIINILKLVDYPKLKQLLESEINPEKQEDMFVRKHAVKAIVSLLDTSKKSIAALDLILSDPSPFVRQGLGETLFKIPKEIMIKYFELIVLKDEDSHVKCSAVNIAGKLLHIHRMFDSVFHIFNECMEKSEDDKLIRFILEILPANFRILKNLQPSDLEKHMKHTAVLIEKLHTDFPLIIIRRKAARCREELWSISDDKIDNLISSIKKRFKKIKPGKSITLKNHEIKNINDHTLGRILSCISQNDYSIQYIKTLLGKKKLIRNAILDFRWWRFFHEFRTPSPDKRQTCKHTIGRHFAGTLRSSSSIMSEVSETKVPGEPLTMQDEGNARPYLPLVDELMSSSESNDKINIYSNEGVTTLQAPKNPLKRFFVHLKLTFNFTKYTKLRNWTPDMQFPASEYISEIKKLGFDIKITPQKSDKYFKPKLDPKVKQFFTFAPILPISLYNLFIELKIYFFSLYQNTIYQLSAFIAAMAALFIGRHIYLSQSIKNARNKIPLVIGGWGTRGKSGTERLKAALFSSLGASVFSKTTGCEAMFLYSSPFDTMTEFILFRPYDKATIWEQYNVVKLASKLKTDVFLWECMALSPTYVKILQRNWMKDDISTITNTFPDHEDIQGPAGWNVADTMINFIPDKGHLITSEEQMFPVLETETYHRNTEFYKVGWKETMLITPDIVERFPYKEHPYNIALVAKIAENLGIPQDYALKEMSDNIIPDIGVLKQYPESKILSRKLIFYSGMSANERYACMQNWYRMNFDKYNPKDEPEIYITTVVNNRADRIARSKVFADILVEDLSANKHFLIGSNLKGMMGYIKNSFDEKYKTFSLWNKVEDNPIDPKAAFNKIADYFRIPREQDYIKNQLLVMISSDKKIDNDTTFKNCKSSEDLINTLKTSKHLFSEETSTFHNKNIEKYEEYRKFFSSIPNSPQVSEKVDQECRELLWKWFNSKLVIVENYYATGNEIVETIAKNTPPGFTNKIMALQNIKGTGLDFFYRWQEWEKCSKICDNVILEDNTINEDFLKKLTSYSHYEILAVNRVKNLIHEISENKTSSDTIKLLAKDISSKLDIKTNQTSDVSTEKESFIKKTAMGLVEDLLDPRFSVKRRKKSDRVYRALAKGSISYSKAQSILLAVTTQQKGGWFKKTLAKRQKKKLHTET
jgi:gamma-polyglutamate synthase